MGVPAAGVKLIGLLLGALVVLAAGCAALTAIDERYNLVINYPDAGGLVNGGRVTVNGFTAGQIDAIETRGGRALVTVHVDEPLAPLQAGTTARIEYQALLGERTVVIEPGDRANPPLPDGAMVSGAPRIDLDDVLQALDEPTRASLRRALPQLADVLEGREAQVQATLATAGPAVDALGAVLAAVGEDGPALRDLLIEVRQLSTTLVDNRQSVRATVDGFERSITTVAQRDEELARALEELPSTLDEASATLAQVPPTAEETLPFLRALRPGTARLPGVAADAAPLLRDLRPTARELRRALPQLRALLVVAPGLLDDTRGFLPPLTAAVKDLQPALEFLRPYTPELAGILTHGGEVAANYDANGHYVRIFTSLSTASIDALPVPPPLVETNRRRAPGDLEGMAPTDANGNRLR